MTKRLVPHPDVVARRLDDALILVNLGTSRIFSLNGTGTRVWELLEAGSSVDEVERRLEDEYEVEKGLIEQEVTDLVGHLEREGLMTEAREEV